MKDKDLKNFKPNGGIRPSPLKVHNGLIANILQSSSLSNGTRTGQFFSLYDALAELCKDKNVLTPCGTMPRAFLKQIGLNQTYSNQRQSGRCHGRSCNTLIIKYRLF